MRYSLISILVLAAVASAPAWGLELAVVGTGSSFGPGAAVQVRQPWIGDLYGWGSVGHAVGQIEAGGWSRPMFAPCPRHTLRYARGGPLRDTSGGLGLGWQRPLPHGWRSRVEAGWSYHWLDGDVTSTVWWDDHVLSHHVFRVRDTQTLDLTVWLVRPLGAKVRLLLGGGYRWDLEQQWLTVASGYASDMRVDLTGWTACAGLGIELQ